MRIEFTDGTAVWEWAHRTLTVGDKNKLAANLAAGDVLTSVQFLMPGPDRTVKRILGDELFRSEGGTWEPVNKDDGAHPRMGVLYRSAV